MVRSLNRLSARTVSYLSKAGRYADGGGLYVAINDSGARRWVFLYRFKGKRHEMGLGGLDAVPLVAPARLPLGIGSTSLRGVARFMNVEPLKPPAARRKCLEHLALWQTSLSARNRRAGATPSTASSGE